LNPDTRIVIPLRPLLDYIILFRALFIKIGNLFSEYKVHP